MGLQVSRLGDMTTGHGCFPPQKTIQGSTNVFIEGKPAFRQLDAAQPHCCKYCHPTNAIKGSMTVYVNQRQLMRVTDPCNCGSRMMTGARTVRAGG